MATTLCCPARNRWDIVIGRTGVEIANFAAKRDKSPYVNVSPGAEIEDAAVELPRCLVGRPSICVRLCS